MHHGLGGLNPIEKYRIHDLMIFLLHQCEHEIPADDAFVTIRTTANAMSAQARFFKHEKDPNGNLHNFRHGSTYLTSIEKGAVLYACANPYGSELLSACIQLIQILSRAGIPVNLPRELNDIDVQRVIDNQPIPVIIEVHGVELAHLLTENGIPAVLHYDFMKSNLDWLDESKFLDLQKTFELAVPFPATSLKLKKVICPKRIVDANFNYGLKDFASN